MDIEKEKKEIKLVLTDLRVEANHLISNIDIALSHIEEIETDKDAKEFNEKYDIEKGLEHIELF